MSFKDKNRIQDPRIRKKTMTWLGILLTYFILLVLSSGQAMVLAEYMGWGQDGQSMPPEYIFGMLGYWAIVTGVFCLITASQMKRWFQRPMLTLSEAAKDVANGDFTVYIEPPHTEDKYDYIDVMFEDFNKMVEELGTIETMKTDFISNVSHEIKTPLAVIENYAMALQTPDTGEEQRKEYTATIISASRRLNALVANILKLSKLENQRIVPTLEDYDLCRQLAECALSFEELLDNKNITLEVIMDDKAVICADRSMLEIVWNNLLSNALKFTEPGGTITLTQTSDEDTVTVSVTDTGCGMDDSTMRRIFDKFYQGDASRSQEGNGLGLALALRVIELLGGQISVKSSPGEGSAFAVSLKTAV
jgi:signal transduction histidine kinase